MNKKVLFGKEAREKLLAGVQKIADAVRVTMGASGKCVLVGEADYVNGFLVQLPTIVTKDGYNVTQHFELTDPIENRGALIIKEAAKKTVEMAGDATTCTCVLAEAIISEGMKLIDEGANSQELKRGIDAAVEETVTKLKEMSTPVSGNNEKIFQVASVSANNDTSIGKLISEAFSKIGHDGVIDIEQSNSTTTEIKITEGYKFSKGWISPLFVNKKEKQLVEYENPLILLYDKRVTHHTQVQRAIEISMGEQRPIVIICEDADQEGLAFLAMNVIRGAIQCCVVTAPEFGDLRREAMEDIAMLTGGVYLSDQKGRSIKEVTPKELGRAKKVIISKDETIIIGGEGDKSEVENTINELKMNMAGEKDEFERQMIEKRIAKINGSVAVIRVGAATETEMKEKLDRVDDAVRATKSAIAEGYVVGSGAAFAKIGKSMFVDGSEISDFDKGRRTVALALSTPLLQIIENIGNMNGSEILREVEGADSNIGYNAKTMQVEDLIKSGIIDSTKALRCALINAASVSGMALTSECLIQTEY